MKQLLPILIVIAFFVLYAAGHRSDAVLGAVGLVLLVLGMSGSLFARFFQKGSKSK